MAEHHRHESSNSASREATSSSENDEGQPDDGTHNTPASESQMTTSTSARKRFGLGVFGRLPPELRNSVYECMFDGEVEASSLDMRAGPPRLLYKGSKKELRRALIPLHACGQMRDEAMPALFRVLHIKLIHKRRGEVWPSGTPIVRPTAQGLKEWTGIICKIPTHLRFPMMKFEYRYDCQLRGPEIDPEDEIVEDGPLFTERIGGLIKSVRPGTLRISILFYFRLGGPTKVQPGLKSGYLASVERVPSYICKRDKAMTEEETQSITVTFPADDPVEARREITKAFEKRGETLEAHRGHKVCFIRLDLDKSLSRLAMAEKEFLRMVQYLPDKK